MGALAQARRLEGDAAVPLRAYLVAARADRGGVAVTRDRVGLMVGELGLNGFFETSAKEGWQVTDLAQAIRTAIDWEALPMVSSNALFDSIKQYLVEEKQQGRLLSTVDDLFRGFQRHSPAAPKARGYGPASRPVSGGSRAEGSSACCTSVAWCCCSRNCWMRTPRRWSRPRRRSRRGSGSSPSRRL